MEQARGNSGTLFSVFLCAAAEPLAGHTRLTSTLLAAALNRAQIRAWSALSDPVPGTMLSVMEAAAGPPRQWTPDTTATTATKPWAKPSTLPSTAR
ncbi:glycerone kinase [Arthrobacter sp. Hiyo4]|nr:glycerone kinase [Arthrobacter sp. Hiyo4]